MEFHDDDMIILDSDTECGSDFGSWTTLSASTDQVDDDVQPTLPDHLADPDPFSESDLVTDCEVPQTSHLSGYAKYHEHVCESAAAPQVGVFRVSDLAPAPEVESFLESEPAPAPASPWSTTPPPIAMPTSQYEPFFPPPGGVQESTIPSTSDLHECIVCAEPKDTTEFRWNLTPHCFHVPETCAACVCESIRRDVVAKPWREVACPDCDNLLSYETLMEYVTPEIGPRYDEISLFCALRDDESFVWVRVFLAISWSRSRNLSFSSSAPKTNLSQCASNCGSGQIHEGGIDQPIVSCVACGHQTCFVHRVSWHAGITCDEWNGRPTAFPTYSENEEEEDIYSSGETQTQTAEQRRVREEQCSETTIRSITQPCPSCGHRIEKAGGS